jgi:hypothetical protein
MLTRTGPTEGRRVTIMGATATREFRASLTTRRHSSSRPGEAFGAVMLPPQDVPTRRCERRARRYVPVQRIPFCKQRLVEIRFGNPLCFERPVRGIRGQWRLQEKSCMCVRHCRRFSGRVRRTRSAAGFSSGGFIRLCYVQWRRQCHRAIVVPRFGRKPNERNVGEMRQVSIKHAPAQRAYLNNARDPVFSDPAAHRHR